MLKSGLCLLVPLCYEAGSSKTMNGKGIIVALVSTGAALAGLILNGQHTTNRAIDGLRLEVKEVRSDVADLRERMARLEGRVDTLVEVIVEQNSK